MMNQRKRRRHEDGDDVVVLSLRVRRKVRWLLKQGAALQECTMEALVERLICQSFDREDLLPQSSETVSTPR
jgi:hypothetical protein